ncbi:family 1 glycosylhydrolase [Blautia glucerasea]|nr:family 1 glycosylhydrolase [Blautia glucerasea]
MTNDPSDKAKFPSDFVWGAATSSYQIEGAVTGDGKVHDPNRIDFLARYLGEV